MGLYVQLDVNWTDSHKIVDASMEVRGLHATALCIAKRLDKDGWIPQSVLLREGATVELIGRLVHLELLEQNGSRFRPWDWLQINPSSEAIRRKKSDSARAANHARWHDGPLALCNKCRSSEPDPDGNRTESNGSLEVEVETEGEAATEPDPARSPEDRQTRIRAACHELATSRAEARTDIGPGWVPAVARGLADEHHQTLHRHLATNPAATIEDLIHIIETASQVRKTEPINTSSFLRPVPDLLAEAPPTDFDLGLSVIAAMKAQRRPTGTPPAAHLPSDTAPLLATPQANHQSADIGSGS